MKIAVIGAGHIGRTLGATWTAAGHTVVYGVRTPEQADERPVTDAVDGASVVLLAVPGAAGLEVVRSLGHQLAGTIVVDATNDAPGSSTLRARAVLEGGGSPVRAFNTLGWENFADPVVGGVQADLLFAAEDGPDRQTTEQLIREVGLDPVWLGGLDAFDVVDSVTQLWFTLVFQRGFPRRTAFKILRDQSG